MPDLPPAGRTPRRDAELARLGKLKTATGVFGDDVLRHAALHPADPEIPCLLHVTVMSTRGGCLDGDAKALSRRAWKLLQGRYGESPWAARTPYFY